MVLKYQGLSDPSATDAGIELVITAGLNWCLQWGKTMRKVQLIQSGLLQAPHEFQESNHK